MKHMIYWITWWNNSITMITSLDDLKAWREASLAYHEASGGDLTYHCHVFFVKARAYFNENGFPEPQYFKNGKIKPFTQKQELEQRKAIQRWIDARR